MPVPIGTKIKIKIPDDYHHHVRDGIQTSYIMKHVIERFHRILIMPNTKPPITTTEQAINYKKHIEDSISIAKSSLVDVNNNLQKIQINNEIIPLMTLYLTDNTTVDEIKKASESGIIVGCKYYPAGVTTNSDHGVTDINKCYDVLNAMVEYNLVLCIHSEVNYGDIFEREQTFIDDVLKNIVNDFPKLKITLEHISTKYAVDYILNETSNNVKASITCHHLLYNINDLLVGGIKPHLYCLPILKNSLNCNSLINAVISGTDKIFIGTDSAPHITLTKLSACGCAGIYTAHAAIELYTELFDQYNSLDKLENFTSVYGAKHYNLPITNKYITLEKKEWIVPDTYQFVINTITDTVTPLRAGQTIQWTIIPNEE